MDSKEPLPSKEPEQPQTLLKKLRGSHKHIPDKKVYIEFVTALLTIPVLLTVILLNINNLKASKSPTTPTPTPVKQIIYISPNEKVVAATIAPTSDVCKKSIGPIAISSPDEGDIVTNNPVTITIDYQQGNYCSAVWSYRINGGVWSAYDNNSLALYNLPAGQVVLDLRVKSVVSSDEKTLKRTFTYKPSSDAQASASAH